MSKTNYYHGTSIELSKKIIIENRFKPSKGDRHWLGDGVYFYEEEFYAYNWLIYEYKKKFGKKLYDKNKINKDYNILSANFNISKERIFKLSEKAEHKILFDITMEETIKKSKYSKRFDQVTFPEGVILNIMFKEMRYNSNFDLIVAIFTRRKSNYGNAVLRLNYIPEKQLCVVNNNIIENIKEFDFKNKVSQYMRLINRLDYKYFKKSEVNSSNTYNSKRNKNIY